MANDGRKEDVTIFGVERRRRRKGGTFLEVPQSHFSPLSYLLLLFLFLLPLPSNLPWPIAEAKEKNRGEEEQVAAGRGEKEAQLA